MQTPAGQLTPNYVAANLAKLARELDLTIRQLEAAERDLVERRAAAYRRDQGAGRGWTLGGRRGAHRAEPRRNGGHAMNDTDTMTVVVRDAEQWAEAAHALTRTIPGAGAEQWAEAAHALTRTIPGAGAEQWAEAAHALTRTIPGAGAEQWGYNR